MSIPKLAGLETEFAITGHSAISDSRSVVLAYPYISSTVSTKKEALRRKREADSYVNRMPDDLMLANGARFYVDHAHPEYSTPETLDPLTLVMLDRAGNMLVHRCAAFVNQISSRTRPVHLYKNNSDHLGNSYGCHENYLMDAGTYTALFGNKEEWIHEYLVPFLVSRIIFTGAGKVGAENDTEPVSYQASQRADFFEEIVGIQTSYRRPIVNTRDEPHADPNLFRRLHVIAGDANMCPYAAWLKVGTMQILLRMLEDGAITCKLKLKNPILAIRQISRDLKVKSPVQLDDGRSLTAVEIQMTFLECAHAYRAQNALSKAELEILHAWEETLAGLRKEPMLLAGKLDWVTKFGVIRQLVKDQDWDSPKMKEADIKYHALEKSQSLYSLMEELGAIVFPPGWNPEMISNFLQQPPPDSRASIRGECIRRFSPDIMHIDWEEVAFRFGFLDLPDPLIQLHTTTNTRLANAATAGEFLEVLRAIESETKSVRAPSRSRRTKRRHRRA